MLPLFAIKKSIDWLLNMYRELDTSNSIARKQLLLLWVFRKLKYIAFDESIILTNKKTQCILIMLKKIHTVKILNPIPTWFAYRWAVRFFPDSEVNSVPSWIMGEIMIPLVTWNLRVSARACGSVLSWSRTLCGSLAKAASVGAKIVKGVAWQQKNGFISI